LARQLRLKLDRREGYRRENFVVSPANAEAVRQLDRWPAWPNGALTLIGPAGAGKSHLARLWAQRAEATTLSPDSWPNDLPGGAILVEEAERAPDVGLFHLLNRAADSGGLLLTARTAPATWPARLPDLRSRLNALAVAQLAEPDDEILIAVFDKFFRERNIRPADDLIPYLLNRIERSVPKAQEIVARIDEAADAEGRAISRALARQILESDPPTLSLFE
jgi:chromosomal replication initiation ATPase DnaA